MAPGIIKNHSNTFSTVFRLLDVTIISGLLLLLCYVFNDIYTDTYLFLTVTTIAIFLLFSETMELYRSWRTDSLLQQLSVTLVTWGMVSGTLAFIMYFSDVFSGSSRTVPFYWLLSCSVVLPAWRLIGRLVLNQLRKKGSNSRTTIIIGVTESGVALARNIIANPQLGLTLVGFCDDREPDRINAAFLDDENVKIIGSVNHAITMAKTDRIDSIYIAMPMSAKDRIQQILNICGNTTATVHIIPDFFTFNLINSRLSKVGDVQTLSVYDTPINGLASWAKRLEDLVISSIILTLIAVPMLIIGLLIKLTSKGPILFKQDRYGLAGEKIKVWKFRSMTSTDNGGFVVQAKKNDARITPFGAFLRKTSLDELPQFFNVLSGSMSVVGPRPHAVAHNEKYREEIGGYMLRHKVKPGITGWAQVNGWRGETETIDKMEKRIEYDLDYLRHWSIFFDLKIVFLTIFKGFSGKNAY